jgi:hypothetical protein
MHPTVQFAAFSFVFLRISMRAWCLSQNHPVDIPESQVHIDITCFESTASTCLITVAQKQRLVNMEHRNLPITTLQLYPVRHPTPNLQLPEAANLGKNTNQSPQKRAYQSRI